MDHRMAQSQMDHFVSLHLYQSTALFVSNDIGCIRRCLAERCCVDYATVAVLVTGSNKHVRTSPSACTASQSISISRCERTKSAIRYHYSQYITSVTKYHLSCAVCVPILRARCVQIVWRVVSVHAGISAGRILAHNAPV